MRTMNYNKCLFGLLTMPTTVSEGRREMHPRDNGVLAMKYIMSLLWNICFKQKEKLDFT